jgi:hypothetical protein
MWQPSSSGQDGPKQLLKEGFLEDISRVNEVYPLLTKRGLLENPLHMVFEWENHRTKWWIFQLATFDYRRVVIKHD